MYCFELFSVDTVNAEEYEGYADKNLFSTLSWLRFLKQWRHVSPAIVRITDESGALVGHFTGGVQKKFGFRIFGSPFYGWMGQHLGFDLAESTGGKLPEGLLDELLVFLRKELKISFMILADFKLSEEDAKTCKSKLFYDTKRWSYFLDLTQSEEQIFKNFKSGYRTCVRKFEKLGGTIVEDMSDVFIEEHHVQLAEVFARKSLTSPNYRERMNLLYKSYPDMVLSIKALDENGNNIASSYYLGAGSMAFFASNASLTEALKYNANQALMWYAIRYWKAKGIKTMDLAGGAAYKENFGSVLKGTPTIVWAKHAWQYHLVMWAKNTYYKSFRVKYKLKNLLHRQHDEPAEKAAEQKEPEKTEVTK